MHLRCSFFLVSKVPAGQTIKVANPTREVSQLSRLINAPVLMTSRPSIWPGARGPEPVTWVYRGARYRVVEVLECWEEAGRWWEQEPPATAWRVRVQQGGVMELIMLHTSPPQWRLMRSWD